MTNAASCLRDFIVSLSVSSEISARLSFYFALCLQASSRRTTPRTSLPNCDCIIYNLCFGQMLCYKLVVRCVHAHRYHDDCRQGVGRHIFKELFKILHRSAFIFDYPTFSVMKEKIADAKYISNFEKQLFNLIENNLNY